MRKIHIISSLFFKSQSNVLRVDQLPEVQHCALQPIGGEILAAGLCLVNGERRQYQTIRLYFHPEPMCDHSVDPERYTHEDCWVFGNVASRAPQGLVLSSIKGDRADSIAMIDYMRILLPAHRSPMRRHTYVKQRNETVLREAGCYVSNEEPRAGGFHP